MRLTLPISCTLIFLLSHTCYSRAQEGTGGAEIVEEDNVPSYVKDLSITEEQKNAIDQLRQSLSSNRTIPPDYLKNDLFLIRWLRAAYFDVPRAQSLLLANFRWKEENKINTIHDEDWSDMQEKYKYSLKGRDKEGKPLMYINVGLWNLRDAIVNGNGDRMRRYIMKIVDEGINTIIGESEKYGNVTQGQVLFNAKGTSPINHLCPRCIQFLLQLVQLVDGQYIGWVQKFRGVNVPVLAQPAIQLARGGVHRITNEAIVTYGPNRDVWWKELVKDFEVDQIPEDLGGTLKPFEKEEKKAAGAA